jgi:hypothetical protein
MEASRRTILVVDHDGSNLELVIELQPDGLWAAGLADNPEAGWPGSGVTPIDAMVDLLTQRAEAVEN